MIHSYINNLNTIRKMTPKRHFYKKGFQHVFQISVDRGLTFYTDADYLVFFSILCYVAVKYHVRITACCIMANHFHIQGHFRTAEDMELFLNELTSIFALMYNRHYHRKGQLFKKSFGSAPKVHDDDIIDNMVYIFNNPIPKHAVEYARAYRWNFLAYMESAHPFSDPLDRITMSDTMKKGVYTIERIHGENKYLTYKIINEVLSGLSLSERDQILDYAISVYNIIDYGPIKQRWGTLDKMSFVLDVVKGSEYDVAEDYSTEDYRHYLQMNAVAQRCGFDLERVRFDSEDVSPSVLRALRWEFLHSLPASSLEIDKYLHQGE